MDKQEKKGIAIGAAIGAVVGVVTGILIAPKSGKETRNDIKKGAQHALSKIEHEAQKVQNETKDLLAKAEEKLASLKGKASENAKVHLADLKHTTSQLAEAAKSFRAGESSDKDLNNAIKKAKEAQESLKSYLKK